MGRWRGQGTLDDAQVPTGDTTFKGMDMKSSDPASIAPGFYREGYNIRVENGGLETRKGNICPGSLNAVQYNQIYGVGLFSNPNGLEWLAVATLSGVWFARDGEYPRFVPLPENLAAPVEFSQCFDTFFIWRGPSLTPLLWKGDWSVYWESFPPPTGGRTTVPNAYTAENAANRMLVPYGKDRIAVSDIADYTEYDWTIDDFQINQGESDDLVRIFPWQQGTVICFKRHSVYRVTGVTGDLTGAVLEKLPGSIGLVGRHAVCDVSGDIYFMSHSGVFTISQVFQNTPQPSDLPITDSIKPIIDSINWNASSLICCGYRRDRVYFAVPLKNSVRNNCLLVYNIATACWESIDTFGDLDLCCDDIIKMDWNGERRLYMVDRVKGLIILMEQGKTDIFGASHDFEYDIDMSVMLRGYQGRGARNQYKGMEMVYGSWNPSITISAYCDGGDKKVLVADKVRDRTKYKTFAKPRWNPLNSNDDHREPRRQDYSVQLPFMLGNNGVQIERKQECSERFPVNLMSRYIQFKLENKTGYINIQTVSIDSYEDQREPRSHT
jgi:hypothetical protein